MLVNLVYVSCQVKNKAFCLTVSELIIFNISQIHVPLLTLPEFIVVKILQSHVGPNVIWFYYIQHFCLYTYFSFYMFTVIKGSRMLSYHTRRLLYTSLILLIVYTTVEIFRPPKLIDLQDREAQL